MRLRVNTIFLIAAGILCVTPEVGWACACVATSLPLDAAVSREIDFASRVFIGRVIRSDDFRIVFEVEAVWKGDAEREITLDSGATALAGGGIQISSCDYSFHHGRRYLVFAQTSARGTIGYSCGFNGEVNGSSAAITVLDRVAERRSPPRDRNVAHVGYDRAP